jgi:hypothetical protein
MRNDLRWLERATDERAARVQDTEEGFWFGDGPQAGMVAARDLRMVAVSTDNPEWTDFTPITLVSPRSCYQKLTIGRDCNLGVVEVDLMQPDTQAYHDLQFAAGDFIQVAVYEDNSGVPGTLIQRCVPLPWCMLSANNTQRFLIPLWAPAAVSKDDIVWVGIMPKAWTGPGEGAPWSVTNVLSYCNSRGNRDNHPGWNDFIKADDVEPPLATYTTHSDRRIYVRLYEAPESIDLAVPDHIGPPRASAGFRATIARPQSGRIESAYSMGVRPGHGTQPYGSGKGGFYWWLGGGAGQGGSQNHNDLGNIQGGLLDERYHFGQNFHDELADLIAGPTTDWGWGGTYADCIYLGGHLYFDGASDDLTIAVGDTPNRDSILRRMAMFVSDGTAQGLVIWGAGMGNLPTLAFGTTPNRQLLVANDAQYTRASLYTHSDTPSHRPMWESYRSRGSHASRSGVQADDYLLQIRAQGFYDSVNVGGGFYLDVQTTEAWSASAYGTRAMLNVRRTGATNLDEITRWEDRQFLLSQDGTTSKPALAFNSEKTLGWRRYGSQTMAFVVNSADELILTPTALRPAADGGLSLGASGYCWQDLFLNPRDASPSVEGQLLADSVRRAHETYIGGDLGQLHRLLHSQTSDTSQSGTSEQTVSTYTIPAASWAAGKVYRFTASGQCSGQAGANVTVRVKIGGNQIFDDLTEGAGNAWRITGEIVCRSRSSSGTVAYGISWATQGTDVDAHSGTQSLNTTAAQALAITHQGGHANHQTTIHTFDVWEA